LFNLDGSTPLLTEDLRSCIYTLIANPGYTLVDIPLLLLDEKTRKMLVANVSNPDVLLFWRTYDQMKPSEQREEAALVLRRVQEFLQPLLRNIVGQAYTTINFKHVLDERKIVLVKFDARLNYVTTLIGSLIISELLNAAYSRSEFPNSKRGQFNLYIDEFQRFATEDFTRLAVEGRKFGIATTIAHQTIGQLDSRSRAVILQMANLAAFRINAKDAEELALNFDLQPIPIESTLKSLPEDGGRQEVVYRAAKQQNIAELQTEIAIHLTTLPRYTAMVKSASDSGTVEYIINTLEAERLYGKAPQERLARIQAQNIQDGYLRRREEVKEEIDKRQQRLLVKAAPFRSQYIWLHDEAHKQVDTDSPLESSVAVLDEAEVLQTTIRIRITEDPLTAQNLVTIISALTELYTKCWLIAKGRFADLIEYTQTGNTRFAQEAHLVITRVVYNSPFNMDWKVDLSAPTDLVRRN